MPKSAIAEIGRHICYSDGGRDEDPEPAVAEGGKSDEEISLEVAALEAGQNLGLLITQI